MHFIILNICAYVLLLSSVITITMLLKKQFKQWKNTSLYVLSMSDVLFSIFTSSILFVNCMGQITYTNQDKINNTYLITDLILDGIYDSEHQEMIFKKLTENLNTTINQNSFNMMQKCSVIHIIMKYGILFFPFSNSFISLLLFSVQCNLNLYNVKNQYLERFLSQAKIYEDNTTTEKSNTEIQLDSAVDTLKSNKYKSRKISTIKQDITKILQVFKCDKIIKDKKIIAIFVLSQWVVPIFVTGLLYLADYDKKPIKNIKDIKCFMESIFFLDDCPNNVTPLNISQSIDFETHVTALYKDYTDNEDLVKLQNSNSTQINEIISKVQNLIYSVMNDTSNIIFNTILYNSSEILNMTKYLELDTYTTITVDNNSTKNESNLIENTLLTQHANADSLVNVKQNINFESSGQLNNYTNKYNEESLLFKYLMMNSSKDSLQEEENNNNENFTNAITLDFKESQTDIDNGQNTIDDLIRITTEDKVPTLTRDQIYAEIFRRIDNISMYHMLKNNYKNKNYYNRMQPKEFKSKQDFQYNPNIKKQSLPSDIKIIIHQDNGANKCFIPIQLLKLHLLILVFVIYFLPILFSSILQQRGKLNCQILLEQLKTKNQVLNSFNFNLDFTNEINDICCNVSINSKELGTLKDDSKHSNEDCQESNNFNKSQFMEVQQEDQCPNASFNGTKMQYNIMNRIESMSKLFDTIKIYLLCAILLWTPLFFELLIKIFTSFYIPQWSLNATYMIATIFNMFRNIFNLKMIKFQGNNASTMKTNSIHPIT